MASKKSFKSHYFLHIGFLLAGLLLGASITQTNNQTAVAGKPATTGFDEYGYNYNAQVFTGKADGVDRMNDGKLWGDTAYANDHLVMKWSKAWNEARFNAKPWTCDAWTDNEWNGKTPNGSGETWHYKIVWVGPGLENSQCWKAGGYPIWGEFEVILSQGTVANQHFWDAHAKPAGYGGF